VLIAIVHNRIISLLLFISN